MAKIENMMITIKVRNIREIKKATKAIDKLTKALTKTIEASDKAISALHDFAGALPVLEETEVIQKKGETDC